MHSGTALIIALISCIAHPALAIDASRSPSPAAPQDTELRVTEDSRTFLLSNSSSLQTISARETSGPDTFAIYGGPDRPDEGKFEVLGGAPSWNGWTSQDMTDHPVYWHVSTFNAENLDGNGAGNHAMWSGQSAGDQPTWRSAPGYGNYWFDVLIYESEPLADPSIGQTVSLDFVFNFDLETEYDYFVVEYDSAGAWKELFSATGNSADTLGVFTAPGVRFSEVMAGTIAFSGNDYGGDYGDQIRIRLVVETDVAWSDEDGLWDTDGAVQVDDITLVTSDGTWQEDFEGSGPYLFMPQKYPFAGDFTEVYPALQDIDPCKTNLTPVIGFVDYGQQVRNGPGTNGMTSTGGEISPGVYYGVPGNFVVNHSGGLTLGLRGVFNGIISPEIPWDLPEVGDNGSDFAGAILRFDVWRDLPIANGILYTWVVRSARAGEQYTEWRNHQWWYFSNLPIWYSASEDISSLLVENPERVQIGLWVHDWAWETSFPGGASTPAPVFDNVTLCKYRVNGVQITGTTPAIPNDSFPPVGSVDTSSPASRDALDVPIDMSRDINSGDLYIVPGDSIAVGAVALVPGTAMTDLRLVWALQKNPLFEDALRSPPSGILHENVDTSDPLVWRGEVVADTCRSDNSWIVEDRYFFDLPDADFMYPGDVLQYYVQATDSDGRITTLPEDLSGFARFDHTHPRYGTMRALPSLMDSAGNHPSILIINESGREESFASLTTSLRELGLEEGTGYDMYWRRAPNTDPNDNGIGSNGAHGASIEQIAGYTTLLYFSETSAGFLLSDGSRNNKSNDIGLLEAWHQLPGRRNMAYFGDRIAEHLARTAGGLSYLNNFIGADYAGRDVLAAIAGQTVPEVRAVHPGFGTSYYTTFNCQREQTGLNQVTVIPHSHVVPAGASVYGHKYVDSATDLVIDGAAASIIHPSSQPGVTGYDVLFPYSLDFIRSPSPPVVAGTPARTLLLGELLTMFDESTPGAPVVAAPERVNLALRVTPNPFNPRTVIQFNVPAGQRGSVSVFNLRGELVRVIHRGVYLTTEFVWDGTDEHGAPVASGVYLVQATNGGATRQSKIALVR